ncbi:MAG: DUF2283 domain-containing protein [Candidatus Aminicenantes bacterium]|nr:DUF2283 domain-containing protein [Candidatus Aminicenantes bacterium]
MAQIDYRKIMNLSSLLLSIPYKRLWYSYDDEADVLYLNFKKPSRADDSELTDDDLIIRYENGEVVGITVLNARKRVNAQAQAGG